MAWPSVDKYLENLNAVPEKRLLSQLEAAVNEEYEAKQSQRDTLHLHPSAMAKTNWCPREEYYKLTGTVESNPQTTTLRRLNIFAEGNSIHDKWQAWMQQAGGLYGVWECDACETRFMGTSPTVCPSCPSSEGATFHYREVPIYNDEHMMLGHADGVWEDDYGRAVIEIKSVGLGTIRWDAPMLYEAYDSGDLTLDELWKTIKRPLLPHRKQVNLYMYALGLTQAIVIYEWKPSQEIKEFHLTLDMDLVQPMLDGAKGVIKALDTSTLPDRPEGYMKSKQCKFCAFKAECWST